MTAKPYDPTLKTRVEIAPESWPVLFGYAKAPTEVIDADIATVSGAADKVLRVAGDPAYLLHLEFVSGHDSATLPSTLLMRNSLLGHRHDLRVRSGAVLLRPESDSPQLTGIYERRFPDEEVYLTFRYAVVRVWQLAPEPLLSGDWPRENSFHPASIIGGSLISSSGQAYDSPGRRPAPSITEQSYDRVSHRSTSPFASQRSPHQPSQTTSARRYHYHCYLCRHCRRRHLEGHRLIRPQA